jgi:hypothetical protein
MGSRLRSPTHALEAVGRPMGERSRRARDPDHESGGDLAAGPGRARRNPVRRSWRASLATTGRDADLACREPRRRSGPGHARAVVNTRGTWRPLLALPPYCCTDGTHSSRRWIGVTSSRPHRCAASVQRPAGMLPMRVNPLSRLAADPMRGAPRTTAGPKPTRIPGRPARTSLVDGFLSRRKVRFSGNDGTSSAGPVSP